MGGCIQKVKNLAADYPMPVVCIWAFTFFYGAISRAPFIFAVHYLVGETKKGMDGSYPFTSNGCLQAEITGSDQLYNGVCDGVGCLGHEEFGLGDWLKKKILKNFFIIFD